MIDLTEPVVAFRSWYIKPMVCPVGVQAPPGLVVRQPKPPALYPMTQHVPWKVGVNEAECHGERRDTTWPFVHKPPHECCACGMHAHVKRQYQDDHWTFGYFGEGTVIEGAVLLWGDMMGGQNVIRAEFAEVLAIVAKDNIARKIANDYDVPAVEHKALEYAATEEYSVLPEDAWREIVKTTKDRREQLYGPGGRAESSE